MNAHIYFFYSSLVFFSLNSRPSVAARVFESSDRTVSRRVGQKDCQGFPILIVRERVQGCHGWHTVRERRNKTGVYKERARGGYQKRRYERRVTIGKTERINAVPSRLELWTGASQHIIPLGGGEWTRAHPGGVQAWAGGDEELRCLQQSDFFGEATDAERWHIIYYLWYTNGALVVF